MIRIFFTATTFAAITLVASAQPTPQAKVGQYPVVEARPQNGPMSSPGRLLPCEPFSRF